jgi:hypothetical protein
MEASRFMAKKLNVDLTHKTLDPHRDAKVIKFIPRKEDGKSEG